MQLLPSPRDMPGKCLSQAIASGVPGAPTSCPALKRYVLEGFEDGGDKNPGPHSVQPGVGATADAAEGMAFALGYATPQII